MSSDIWLEGFEAHHRRLSAQLPSEQPQRPYTSLDTEGGTVPPPVPRSSSIAGKTLDIRTALRKLFLELLKAAIEMIDAIDQRLAVGH